MRKYRWIILGIALTLMCSVFSQAQSGDEAALRAQSILEQARLAIGGPARLGEVKSLSVSGKVHQPGEAATEENNIKLNLVMDDGMVSFDMFDKHGPEEGGDVNVIIRRERIEKGEVGVVENPGEPGPRKKIIIKQIDDGQPLPPGVGHSLPPGAPETRHMGMMPPLDLPNLMLGWLLKTHPETTLKYAGEAENGTLEVIEAKNPHEPFAAKLFIDKSSHLPVMLSYRGMEPMMVFFNRHDEHERSSDKQTAKNTDKNVEFRVIETDSLPRVPGNEVDVVLRFSDHRMVDGVMLPYHITRSVNGELKAEWDLEKYQINAPIEMPRERMRRRHK